MSSDEEYIGKQFWDAPSETYVWYRKKQLMLSFIKDMVEKKDNLRILDMGCNNGTDLFSFSKLINKKHEYVGLDIDKQAISFANKRVKNDKLNNFKFYCMDIVEQDVTRLGKFDIILSSEVIEHVYNHDLFLKKAHIMLNEGGYVMLTTPNKDNIIKKLVLRFYPNVKEKQSWYFDRHGADIEKDKEGYMNNRESIMQHVSEVNKKQLRQELIRNGFEIVKLKSSAISYGSPVLDNNKFLFFIWTALDAMPLFGSKLGYDICVLARKV